MLKYTFWRFFKAFQFGQGGLHAIRQNGRHVEILVEKSFPGIPVALEEQEITIRMDFTSNSPAYLCGS